MISMIVSAAIIATIDTPASRGRCFDRSLTIASALLLARAVEHLLHVVARLAVGRHAAVAVHRAGAGVVGGQRLLQVAAVARDERAQGAGAAVQGGRQV